MMCCTRMNISPPAKQMGKQKYEKHNYSHSAAKIIKVLKEKNPDNKLIKRLEMNDINCSLSGLFVWS